MVTMENIGCSTFTGGALALTSAGCLYKSATSFAKAFGSLPNKEVKNSTSLVQRGLNSVFGETSSRIAHVGKQLVESMLWAAPATACAFGSVVVLDPEGQYTSQVMDLEPIKNLFQEMMPEGFEGCSNLGFGAFLGESSKNVTGSYRSQVDQMVGGYFSNLDKAVIDTTGLNPKNMLDKINYQGYGSSSVELACYAFTEGLNQSLNWASEVKSFVGKLFNEYPILAPAASVGTYFGAPRVIRAAGNGVEGIRTWYNNRRAAAPGGAGGAPAGALA